MKAVMIFPILKQESGNMVLSLNHRTQGHVWSMAEIKFTADAVKILQSILTRRIQKNSLAGSYAALEEILDNVGCAIYVTDQTTGRMLFANQILKNTFAKELLDHNFDALLQSSVRKEKTKSVSVVYHDTLVDQLLIYFNCCLQCFVIYKFNFAIYNRRCACRLQHLNYDL